MQIQVREANKYLGRRAFYPTAEAEVLVTGPHQRSFALGIQQPMGIQWRPNAYLQRASPASSLHIGTYGSEGASFPEKKTSLRNREGLFGEERMA